MTAVAPIESVDRDGDARPNGDTDLERLRTILFGDSLGTLDARVADVERAEDELHARLPAAIERAGQGAGAGRMASALATPVTRALGTAVRENRALIVDMLFPVIGPAIRKAIAEALRNLVADVNRTIESSFTPRGILWRVEAWRTGVPYAAIVLAHTLRYGIDHVFLIERDSGLVLARESAPHLPELDADAIAGMLTAIGEFVRDSVGRGMGDTLDSARVGEQLLQVVHGPRASLACFVHGVPPARLRAVLERRLEAIHERAAGGAIANDEATHASLRPEALVAETSAGDRANAPAPSRWPARIALLALVVLVGALIVRSERAAAWLDGVRSRLAAHPGFVTTGIEKRGDTTIVRGLLDPDAEPPAKALGDDASRVAFETAGYVSADDAVIARRARRLLDAPASVTIDVRGGALRLGGHADGVWIQHASDQAAWVPGVGSVAFDVASDTDLAALHLREEIDRLARDIGARRIAFVRDTELADGAGVALDALVSDMSRVATLARGSGASVMWTAIGTNDDPGTDSINTRLRAERARWLADALVARGIANVRADAADEGAASQRERAAFVQAGIVQAKP